MPELRPYQLEAIKEIREKKRVLIADDMGLGKSAEAIAAKTIIDRDMGYESPALIVCPTSVTDHWEREIKKWYKKGEETNVARIQTSSYHADLKRAKGADFVIVNYSTLSYFGNSNEIRRLKALNFVYGIIDEAHNARNPDSLRSAAAREIFHSPPYLVLTTGTPLPNTVVDIYSLLNLLDKDTFAIKSDNPNDILARFYAKFKEDPEVVKNVLNSRMLRRNTEDYLNKKFPKLNQQSLEIRLEEEHGEAYKALYEQDSIRPSDKLRELIRASIDPNLVRAEYLPSELAKLKGKMRSSVYAHLDNLFEKVIDSNGKVLLFTDLKEGVVNTLLERYSKYGFLAITGDTDDSSYEGESSEREAIRRTFQKDPNCKGLITTTVMDEGCDLTAATDVVHLTLPFIPATFDQRNRRSQRVNAEVEKDQVNVHVVKPYIDKFTPLITTGIERLLNDKRTIINFILSDPYKITKEMLEEIKNGKNHESKRLSGFIKRPYEQVMKHLGSLKGMGSRKIKEEYARDPTTAENIAYQYAAHWEGNYGGNTGNLTAKIIEALESREDLSEKLDIACGPFSLSRKLGTPITNLDINAYMIKAGRLLEKQGKIPKGNIAHVGVAHKMPFKDSQFDLANCSLALHMMGFNKKKSQEMSEREAALRETNRVLRNGGHFTFTLPYTLISDENLSGFYEALDHLGFAVSPVSGFYKGPKDTTFKVFAGIAQKKKQPSKSIVPVELLSWKMDSPKIKKIKTSGSNRKNSFTPKSLPEPRCIDEFYAFNGKSIEEMLG